MCTLLGGCPPFHICFRASPPISLMHVMRGVSMLQFRGVPPFLLYLAARRVRALPSWGVPLSPPCACVMHALRFGGFHSSSSPWPCDGVAHSLARVSPSLSCPRAVCARCRVGGPPSSSLPWPRARVARCCFRGSPSGPWLRSVCAHFRVRVPLPPSSPGWLHALSVRGWLGGLCFLLPSSCMPRARSARCPVSFPR